MAVKFSKPTLFKSNNPQGTHTADKEKNLEA